MMSNSFKIAALSTILWVTACGSKAGLDLSTTPPAEVMILASALQTNQLIEAVGTDAKVYLVRSDALSNKSTFTSRTVYNRTFLAIGSSGNMLIDFTLESKNGKDFKLEYIEFKEPVDLDYEPKESDSVEFRNFDEVGYSLPGIVR